MSYITCTSYTHSIHIEPRRAVGLHRRQAGSNSAAAPSPPMHILANGEAFADAWQIAQRIGCRKSTRATERIASRTGGLQAGLVRCSRGIVHTAGHETGLSRSSRCHGASPRQCCLDRESRPEGVVDDWVATRVRAHWSCPRAAHFGSCPWGSPAGLMPSGNREAKPFWATGGLRQRENPPPGPFVRNAAALN